MKRKQEENYKKQLTEYNKKLHSLKPQFDEIRTGSYSKGLEFWEVNIMPLLANHPLKPLSNPLTATLYLTETSTPSGNESDLFSRKDVLTICPVNEEENEIYLKWYEPLYIKFNPQYDITEVERQYHEKESIINELDKKKYIENEITKLKKREYVYLGDETIEKNYKSLSETISDRRISPPKKQIYSYYLGGGEPDWRKAKRETINEYVQIKFIIKSLKFWKGEFEKMQNENAKQNVNVEKLKWNCSPSILGYLITELANKGYIEYPLYNGEINPTGLAKICFAIFDTNSTLDNLKKEFNPNKNTLSETKRKKFKIEELKDLQ